MATIKYVLETSDLGRLIRGETIDLAQRKGNIRGFELELIDNPTNGDMIKAMFPDCEFVNALPFTDGRWESVEFTTDNRDKPTQLRTYDNWWDAPYKGVEE